METKLVSTHAALVYTMVMVSAADREMKDVELSLIGHIVKRLPVFDGYDVELLPETTSTCAEILSAEEGLETALDIVADTVPENLRETAYALAVEVAAADRRIEPEEMRLLEMIRHQLGVDRLVAAAIERSARARFATG